MAARDLKQGRRAHHPELLLFTTWHDLQEYAAYDPNGRDLQPFVDLVDAHGPDAILAAVARLVPEDAAQVTVSTAHKAKGREWASVRIGNDFEPPASDEPEPSDTQSPPSPIDKSEARLAYVAVTRTRQRLDLGGLSWGHQPDEPDDSAGGLTAVRRRDLPDHRTHQCPKELRNESIQGNEVTLTLLPHYAPLRPTPSAPRLSP